MFSVRYELEFYASLKLILFIKALSRFRRFVVDFTPRMPASEFGVWPVGVKICDGQNHRKQGFLLPFQVPVVSPCQYCSTSSQFLFSFVCSYTCFRKDSWAKLCQLSNKSSGFRMW